MRSVVVTGLGFATCLGLDQAEVVDRLRNLRHGIQVFEPFVRAQAGVTLAAPVPGFGTDSVDPEDWTYPEGLRLRLEQLRALPPHGLYGLYAVQQLIEDAGLRESEVSAPRTGLFTASAGSPMMSHHHMTRLKELGPQRTSPLSIVSSISGTLSFNLASYYQIRGASCGFVSACASSGHALGYAFEEIASGRQERMIVVGAEDCTLETILPFASMRVLSLSDDPDRASRPFDRNRDGFVGTGGAVAMLLEDEEVAHARGAKLYARFLGWGQGADGYHMAMAHPEGRGLQQAMEAALASAGREAEAVDYVNAHATSTLVGDISECRALRAVFGTAGATPGISSTKALTGHALSLASVMEGAFTVLAIHHGFTPGSAHIEELDPEAADLRILRQTIPSGPRLAMSNSSGFGGANVSLLFGAPT